MGLKEYMWLVSTYRPAELGPVESYILDNFIYNHKKSTYEIYKTFQELPGNYEDEDGDIEYPRIYYPKPMAYKNVHKRVKRLAQLKLIEPVKGHFKRGAKYYKISPYGLISYVGRVVTEINYLRYHKDNYVIRSLLLEFLSEGTVDSFRTLKEFPTADIGEYLHDCCLTTILVCRRFWSKIEQYNLEDILPNDIVIQKYMSYLDGVPVDKQVLDEVEKYKAKLLRRRHQDNLDPNRLRLTQEHNIHKSKISIPPTPVDIEKNITSVEVPFPLHDMYWNIVLELKTALENKAKLFAFSLVLQLGEMVTFRKPIESREELEERLLESNRDYSLYNILNDEKFLELVRNVKIDLENGYRQFLYYQ